MKARRRLRALHGVAAASRTDQLVRRPRLVAGAAGLGLGALAAALAGPVAGLVAVAYAVLAVAYGLRRRRGRTERAARSRALDGLAALAADLRAGLPAEAALAAVRPAFAPVPAVLARVGAAWQVADETGAPLADLLDRLEVDLRGVERVRLAAAAHAAGTRATAGLLAVLPVAGIGVGYGMGAHPLAVLLGTPLGAGCAAVAVLLQVAGLVWTDRLSRLGGEPG
jgi:tight adherence protein B